jgi:prophage regulatory protein
MALSPSTQLRVLRHSAVVERTGLSYATIRNEERAGRFPKRIALAPRSVGWIEGEIEHWLFERIAGARDPAVAEAARHLRDPNRWTGKSAATVRSISAPRCAQHQGPPIADVKAGSSTDTGTLG